MTWIITTDHILGDSPHTLRGLTGPEDAPLAGARLAITFRLADRHGKVHYEGRADAAAGQDDGPGSLAGALDRMQRETDVTTVQVLASDLKALGLYAPTAPTSGWVDLDL